MGNAAALAEWEIGTGSGDELAGTCVVTEGEGASVVDVEGAAVVDGIGAAGLGFASLGFATFDPVSSPGMDTITTPASSTIAAAAKVTRAAAGDLAIRATLVGPFGVPDRAAYQPRQGTRQGAISSSRGYGFGRRRSGKSGATPAQSRYCHPPHQGRGARKPGSATVHLFLRVKGAPDLLAISHPVFSWPTLAISGTAFLLGCRHGFDWDHISAITDLTAAAKTEPQEEVSIARQGRRLGLAFWYCVGHGSVIALLGLAVGVLGLDLPGGIDRIFESVVGATLVALGGFVLWQLGRDRGDYRYSGRIRLLVGVVRRAWARARRRGTVPAGSLDDLSSRSAFAVGVLHGTGAETPTQVVLFASAATSGSRAAAALLLLSFVAGMILADLGIAASWLAGLLGARSAPKAQVVLGALTGVSSLAVGSLFLVGRSAVLPFIFGG